MTAVSSTFQAAIPGMSLTHKMGTLPHEKPPRFVYPNDALEHIWKMLNQREALKQIWFALEQGITVWHINRALLYKLCLEGTIQLNLAIVIGPTVFKMITVIGHAKGITMKLQPKFRSKVVDAGIENHINDKLGRKDNPQPIPKSSFKNMMLPPAEDITKAHEKFVGRQNPKNGILEQAMQQQKTQA